MNSNPVHKMFSPTVLLFKIGNKFQSIVGNKTFSLCQAPSLGSVGSQDSALGLQYVSSPGGERQQDRPPTVYIPPTHTDSGAGTNTQFFNIFGCECRCCLNCKLSAAADGVDCEGSSDRSCRGQTPPPPPPAAAAVSAGLSDSHTPLVGPAWLLYGSTAAVVYSPPAGGAAVHCNIPEHRETVSVCNNEPQRHTYPLKRTAGKLCVCVRVSAG